MKIQVLSDTHLEQHQDGGKSFLDRLDPTGVDVLVCAGDIGNIDGARKNNLFYGLGRLCRLYPQVLMVPGNHEFWGQHRDPVMRSFRDFKVDGNPNFHLLDCSAVEIDGQRFLGATLWFQNTAQVAQIRFEWNEFEIIKQFGRWVFRENRKAVEMLNRQLRPTDVVVTHYLPSWASADPFFANSSTNDFYITDLEPLIRRAQPKLWVHGHTHISRDYQIDKTRVLCNPFGYPYRENPDFIENLVVEV